MLVLNGKPLSYDRAFSHDGIQYPANWLRLASPEERAAIGIEERPNPPVWDQRFYWGYTEDGQLIDKDLDQLKEQWTSTVKATANTMLATTDWAIVRSNDPSSQKPVSAAVLEERGTIRAKSDEKELAIQNAATVAELAAYVTSSEFSSWSKEEPIIDGGDSIDFIGGSTSSGMMTSDALFGSTGEDTLTL